jgi:hypothetical protein
VRANRGRDAPTAAADRSEVTNSIFPWCGNNPADIHGGGGSLGDWGATEARAFLPSSRRSTPLHGRRFLHSICPRASLTATVAAPISRRAFASNSIGVIPPTLWKLSRLVLGPPPG